MHRVASHISRGVVGAYISLVLYPPMISMNLHLMLPFSSYSFLSLLWCISPRWCLWELVARLNRIASTTADMTPLNKPNIFPRCPLLYFLSPHSPLSCISTPTVILSHLFTSSFPRPVHLPRERTFYISLFHSLLPFVVSFSAVSQTADHVWEDQSALERNLGTEIFPVRPACAAVRLIWLDNDWLHRETSI